MFAQPGSPVSADLATGKITYAEAPAPSAAWKYVHFGAASTDPAVAGDDVDPNLDKIPNLGKSLNTDPLIPDARAGISPGLVTINGQSCLAVTFRVVTGAADITYRIAASADLQTWEAGNTSSGTNRLTQTVVTTEFARSGAGLEWITVRDQTPLAEAAQRFLRLDITRP